MKTHYGKTPKNTTLAEIFKTLSPKNRALIKELGKHKTGEVTSKRVDIIKNSLIKFGDLLELDFNKAKKNEVTLAWNIVYSSKEIETKSKQDDYANIKLAFKYWFGDDEEYPKSVRGMKRPSNKGVLRLPKKMPTESEITDAIKKCRNSRDKFLVSWMGLDSAVRPCEARASKWGHVEKDKEGYFIRVKTAKESGDREDRVIRIIYSEPYFLEWMKDYPSKREDDDYIFCNLDDPKEPMTADGITSLFRRLKKRIKFTGKFSAYTLRHACLTRYSKNPNVSIPLLKVLAGHAKSSNILSEYQHFGDDDVKDMQLVVAGREKRAKKSYELKNKPVSCPHCNYSNEADAEVCLKCKFTLSQQRMVVIESIEDRTKMETMEKKIEMLIAMSMKMNGKKFSDIPEEYKKVEDALEYEMKQSPAATLAHSK